MSVISGNQPDILMREK